MSLQDDYYELKAELKGPNKKRLERIWEAFIDLENELEESRECVKLINLARNLLQDKPPLSRRK